MLIKRRDFLTIDVESKNKDRKIPTCHANALEKLSIIHEIATPFRKGFADCMHQNEFRVSLDKRQTEKQKHGKREKPWRDGNTNCHCARDDTNRVTSGQHKNVEDCNALQVERIRNGDRNIHPKSCNKQGGEQKTGNQEATTKQKWDQEHAC